MAVVFDQPPPPELDLEQKFIFSGYYSTYAAAFYKVLQVENLKVGRQA